MTMEDLLEECGGLGKFQFMVIFGTMFPVVTSAWSMLQMSFVGSTPDWYCAMEPENGTYQYSNLTLRKCSMNNSLTGFQEENCQSHFFKTHASTVVSEWDLVCDQQWIKKAITSIQMCGVLVGAILSGQLSDWMGRKKSLFGFAVLHCVVNFAAAFSTSWEMFAVFRFFVGAGIGGQMVSSFPYTLEFVTLKWRPMLSIIPTFTIGISLLALAGLIISDWSYMHIALSVLCLPTLLGFLFFSLCERHSYEADLESILSYMPESIRWLTIKGRCEEAVVVFERMAAMNGKTAPSNTKKVLQKIYQQEQEAGATKYSYKDLFGNWKLAKSSLIFTYVWMILSLAMYGISFGVSALSGNLSLNIFVLAIVELPAIIFSFFLVNRVGRKWTSCGMLAGVALFTGGCLVISLVVTSDSGKNWISGFVYVAKMCLGAGWSVVVVWTNESYPTVIRSLGFGLVNSSARIGGMVAPFVIDLETQPKLAYVIICATMTLAVVLFLIVPETKGQSLADCLDAPTYAVKDLELADIAKGGGHKTTNDSTEPNSHDSNSEQGENATKL